MAEWRQGGVTLITGDCLDVLASMEAESVNCVVTSPPFWGLRKYDCEPSIWPGLMPGHDEPHQWGEQAIDGEGYAGRTRWQHVGGREAMPEGGFTNDVGTTATCSLCGAWRGWLGLEPTVEMFIEHTLTWMRAVKRVLRNDGVLWVDIDDSRNNPTNATKSFRRDRAEVSVQRRPLQDIPPKSLCLIPQRLAIAAQEDGWIVRSDIKITSWMPESAKDRPTDAYRTLLMLVKQGRYWSDLHAVRVPQADGSQRRADDGHGSQGKWGSRDDVSRVTAALRDDRWDEFVHQDGLRNLGNVWDLPPAAYPDAHFATFPAEEPLRCIKASCPVEVCVKCGEPRKRVVKATGPSTAEINELRPALSGRAHQEDVGQNLDYRGPHTQTGRAVETEGWTSCSCGAGFQPGIVLDPFVGTGTTLIATRQLGRRAIGIDVSENYIEQAKKRLLLGDKGIRRMVEARRAGHEQEMFPDEVWT